MVLTLDSSANFIDAMAVLFASFYVFNIEYQEAAACTLELVQRQVNAFPIYTYELYNLRIDVKSNMRTDMST